MKVIDIIKKDLRISFSDKEAIILLIIMPIILISVLGLSLSFSFKDFSEMEKVKIAVVKEYNLEMEKDELLSLIPEDVDISEVDFGDFDFENIFFEDFLGNDEIEEILEHQIVSKDEATKLLKNKEITAIVILPKGFIKDTMVNFGTNFRNVVEIKVVGSTDRNIGSTIVEEVIKGFSDILNYEISAKNSFTRIYNRLEVEDDIGEHIEIIIERISTILETERPEIEYEPLNDRPPMTSRAYYAFGMTAMFVLFGAGYGSKFLLEEKHMKTYDRMSIGGVKKSSIVIGKAATIFLIIFIQMIVLYLFSTFTLKVEWGHFGTLLIIFVASAFAVAGLGILLASIVYSSDSYNIGNLFTSFLVQVLSVLGGSMIPIESMPSFARMASNFTPNGLVLKALMKNYYGYSFGEYFAYILGLLVFGIIFSVISVWILNKAERRSNHVKHIDAKADAV